jgi:hypothetical protein
MSIKSFVFLAFTIGLGSSAHAAEGCPTGTFSIVNSSDGTSLSILFDAFSVSSSGGSGSSNELKECNLKIPLHLPEGYSLGVYRVDYRGFAHLAPKQTSELTVDYHLGRRDNGRQFHRKTKGQYDGEFLFTENIGAGQMKRVGCGEAAVLNASITLALTSSGGGAAMATLDSSDGAARGGLIYYFDTKKCRP